MVWSFQTIVWKLQTGVLSSNRGLKIDCALGLPYITLTHLWNESTQLLYHAGQSLPNTNKTTTRGVRRQRSSPERGDPIWKQSLEVIIVKKTVTDWLIGWLGKKQDKRGKVRYKNTWRYTDNTKWGNSLINLPYMNTAIWILALCISPSTTSLTLTLIQTTF